MGFYEKLKNRFGVESDKQMILILITFSLTGSTIGFGLKPLIWNLLNIQDETPCWQTFLWWLLFVFPAYYICLLAYGALLGQFQFFLNWVMRKKNKPSDKTD